jgi:oxygen-independent coproporphyrinogen-3 oxidase
MVRFANADELEDYDACEGGSMNRVKAREAFEEAVFLGLRLNEGVAENALRAQFTQAWVNECAERVAMLAREGLMSVDSGRWRLTARGRLVSSEVFGELLAAVSA